MTVADIRQKIAQGDYVLALDSDKAELVGLETQEKMPVERNAAREIVKEMWWLTKEDYGSRSGYVALGLPAGPSYWCFPQ